MSIHGVFYFVQCSLKLFDFLFLETNAMGEKHRLLRVFGSYLQILASMAFFSWKVNHVI